MKCCDSCSYYDMENESIKTMESTFDLGKWWPGIGLADFETWKKEQLNTFQKRYNLTRIETFDTYTGGILLCVRGSEKEGET